MALNKGKSEIVSAMNPYNLDNKALIKALHEKNVSLRTKKPEGSKRKD